MVSEYNLSTEVIASLVEGLMDDQAPQVLLKDEEALIQYAYKVAGTVGLLMCEILNNSDLRPNSMLLTLVSRCNSRTLLETSWKMPKWGAGIYQNLGQRYDA